MKGLLIKDFRLMKNMKNSLLLIIVSMAIVGTSVSNISFFAIYLAFMGITFAQTTLSYDEFDNGYSFLLTLPVTRRGYVAEKYIFGLIMSGCGWLLGTIAAVIGGAARNAVPAAADSVAEALIMLPVALIMMAVMFPFRLKFEGEKGRTVMMIVAVGIIGSIAAVATAVKKLNINLDGIEERLPVMSAGAVTAGMIVIGLIVLLLSYRISVGIMEKKEF